MNNLLVVTIMTNMCLENYLRILPANKIHTQSILYALLTYFHAYLGLLPKIDPRTAQRTWQSERRVFGPPSWVR